MSVSALCPRFFSALKLSNSISHVSQPILKHCYSSLLPRSVYMQGQQQVFHIQDRKYVSKARAVKIAPTKSMDFNSSGDGEKQKELNPKEIIEMYKDIPELKTAPESVKKLFTLQFATGKEKLQHRKVVNYNRICSIIGVDTSVEKQIAHMTVKIRNLIPYCLAYRKDKVSKVHLIQRIRMRKKLLKNLRKLDYERFIWLLKELKITYIPNPRYNFRMSRRARRKREARETMLAVKRQKIAEYKAVVEVEKEKFLEHKSEVMAQIEKTIETYGIDRSVIKKAYLSEGEPVEIKK